jgi:VWFA-related protein
VYYGVFMIDQRLSVLQQYTTDREAVMRAVDKATSASYSLYTSESDRIEQELKVLAAQDTAQSSSSVGNSGSPDAGQKGGMAVAAMAQMTLNMLQLNQAMDRAQQGRASIFGLMALVKEQYRLPGRKTLLYFSEGLLIPEFLVDQFQAVIGLANRANVSVYAVDAKGLVTYAQNSAGGSMLQEASASSRSQQNNRPQPVTPDQVRALDVADDSTRSNVQNSLADLSQSTGGFLVADTNDLRKPLQRISEDIGTYYEVTYTPEIDQYDGSFRKIAVKVSRPDVRVQTRSGYFALPFVEGQTLMPYEVPMLNAFLSASMPRKIPFHSSALQFRAKDGAANTAFVIEVPLEGITFTKDETAQKYKTHLSVLAIIKNSAGAVVDKFSRDVPAQGPLTELDATKAGHFIYTQHKELPPGRYTLETAVLDRETMAVGAKRQVLMVAAPSKGLAVSSLALVRSVAPEAAQGDPDDPFQFKGGKITPTLDDTIPRAPGSKLSLYFDVYSDPAASEQPKLTIEFLLDGTPVARGEPTLPPADANGRITYIANSPIDNLKPGQYVIQAVVKQGTKVAQQRTVVTLE